MVGSPTGQFSVKLDQKIGRTLKIDRGKFDWIDLKYELKRLLKYETSRAFCIYSVFNPQVTSLPLIITKKRKPWQRLRKLRKKFYKYSEVTIKNSRLLTELFGMEKKVLQ